MAIYLYNLLSIPVYASLIKNRKLLIFCISTQMFLILALRAELLGVDLALYTLQYDHYQIYSFGEILKSFRFLKSSAIPWGHESGFVLLCWIVGRLGIGFYGFQVICAAISMAGISVFFYRYAEDIPLSYLFFLAFGGFGYFFGILRQSIGLIFFFMSLSALKECKAKKFFFGIILATLFHAIFIAGAGLWFLCKIPMTRKLGYMIAAGAVAAVAMLSVLVRIVIYPILLQFGGYEDATMAFQWNNMFLFMLAILLFILFFDRSWENSLRRTDGWLYWSFIMALPLQCVAFYISTFSRGAIGIFLPAGYALFGNVLRRYPERKTALFIRLFTGLFLILFYMLTIRGDKYIIPYVSVFA